MANSWGLSSHFQILLGSENQFIPAGRRYAQYLSHQFRIEKQRQFVIAFVDWFLLCRLIFAWVPPLAEFWFPSYWLSKNKRVENKSRAHESDTVTSIRLSGYVFLSYARRFGGDFSFYADWLPAHPFARCSMFVWFRFYFDFNRTNILFWYLNLTTAFFCHNADVDTYHFLAERGRGTWRASISK